MNTGQLLAFETVQRGNNVFLTGPAGSGKSYLIRAIVAWANSVKKTIAVTALTGCAALLLGNAKTLHSWAGIGLAKETVDVLVAGINRNPNVKRRWKKTDILVIDEVSMMTPCLFEKLDLIGRKVRNSDAPWGGIQLVTCGDFFQLPPVGRSDQGRFTFESPSWKTCQPAVLTKIERQTDADFQTLLNECRVGTPSETSIALLRSRQGLDWKSQLIKPTLLFSRNADVDSINEKNIAALKKPIVSSNVRTVIEGDKTDLPRGEHLERVIQRLEHDAPFCPRLDLCVGCQVMLLVNKDMKLGLVNGSRGVVVAFRDKDPIVQFLHGEPVCIEPHRWTSHEHPAVHREQYPLRVAYAISIHKSQGATLDCALVDIGSSVFEYGQAYVALSRVRNLESLFIWNLNPAKIMAHPTVVAYYEGLSISSSSSSSSKEHSHSQAQELQPCSQGLLPDPLTEDPLPCA